MRIGCHSGTTRAPGAERGIIIVVALLVLLSLAGVAIVATHRVSLEIDRGGNYRMQKRGALVTQIGSMAGLALLEQQGTAVMDQVRSAGDTALSTDPDDQWLQRKIRLNMNSFAELDLFDPSQTGTLGLALESGAASFETHIEVLGEADGAVAGFSAGEYSFSRVVMTTWGRYGLENQPADDVPEGMVVSTAENQMRVFLLVGPQTVPQVAR